MPEITQPIQELQRKFRQAFKTLSPVIGNEVVNFAKDNFKRQGFVDTAFNPWKPRTSKIDKGRAILIKTRRLERSIHVIRSNEQEVVVGSSAEVPYARAHNEGFKGLVKQNVKSFQRKTIKGVQTVKAHSRTINQNIPQRKFLGKSANLTDRLKRIATTHFQKFI
jgi:phage gpG-like protein